MTAETATADTNTPELEVKNPAALLAKNLELLRERIEALQSEKESLYAALAKESIRAANEKLRAEKMALQHRMQADMHISACKELASLRAAAHKPLTEVQMHEELAALCKRIFNAHIGKACINCDGGTYQSDNNGYGQFHRCNKCRYVPMWGEDGREFGSTAASKGGQHGTD